MNPKNLIFFPEVKAPRPFEKKFSFACSLLITTLHNTTVPGKNFKILGQMVFGENLKSGKNSDLRFIIRI